MTQQFVMGLRSNQQLLHNSSSVLDTNDNDPVSQIFDHFCAADTFQAIMELFQQLCDTTGLYPKDHVIFYQLLKTRLMSWKAQSLWTKLDKRAMCSEYKRGVACQNTRVLIIGAGPCGLRVAIEMALLGAKAVVVEKRDSFSRNNVLHLWPFLIYDLKALGAKKFFGKFCAGSIDHISIRTLQCILLKVALLLGVEVHPNVSFEGFVEPCLEETLDGNGWHAKVYPADHPVSEFIFDVCFSADGKRNTMSEFKRKELRGKFAIGLTANFINRKSQAEASVEEISGLAYIFNQKFFKDLHENVGVDLENIVYYKDETHYFVMTAKKHSLLHKGVLLQDYDDPESLLSKGNVNMDALLCYAREAADYSTNHCLPSLDFAPNHLDQPDVDMFDFTSMFSAEHACRVIERLGHKLLIGLVGDTLLEPFWPTGSGCARGFLGALDGAWMVRSWASGEMSPLEVIAERESVYQLLSQTKSENLNKNYVNYTIDPNTRYPNLQMQFYKPYQVQSLYDGNGRCNDVIQQLKQENSLYDSLCRRHRLLQWFQKKLEPYEKLVKVVDLAGSWRSGLALCAFIHRQRPHLVDAFALDPDQVESNNQLVFDILEKHCNILPVSTGHQMAECEVPDEQTMISYLSAVQDFFKHENPHSTRVEKKSSSERALRTGFIQTHKKKNAVTSNKSRKVYNQAVDTFSEPSAMKDSDTVRLPISKVTLLARDLASKFKGELAYPEDRKKVPKSLVSSADVCSFCKERVFIVERCIAEGLLFHRQCFRCEICSGLLNITSYSFQKNGEGREIFCHAKCHEKQLKAAEKWVHTFNYPISSRVILPVDRITFNATRNRLLKQSKVNQNETRKKEHKQDRMNQRNFIKSRTYDNLSSSTEEELRFSSESDSEKPDLSWDECVRENEAFLASPLGEKITSLPGNSHAEWRMESTDSGGSDADWETESEMDIPLQGSKNHNADKIETEASSGKCEITMYEDLPNENSKPSIVPESKLQNRKAFFDAVAQPVRINARLFLGLDPQQFEGGSQNKTSPDKSTRIKEAHCEDNEAVDLSEDTKAKDIQGMNDIARIAQGSEQETTSERRKKQKKRKKQLKVKRKKLKKTKRQTSERKKAEGVPCMTTVASATVAAMHQTVALVPLSEEETSSDEEETEASPVNPESCRTGFIEISTDGSHLTTDSVLCVSSNSEQVEKLTQTSMEKADSRCLPADSDIYKEELSDSVWYPSEPEGKAPRAGLLSAEAMFSSYEEAAVAMTSDQPEVFSESTGEDEDNVLPRLAEDNCHVKSNVEASPMEDDAVMVLEHHNTEQNQTCRPPVTDRSDDVMSVENLPASDNVSLNISPTDSDGNRMNLQVGPPQQGNDLSQSVNSGHVEQNDVLTEVGVKEHDDDVSVGNDEDGRLGRNKENLLAPPESGVKYENEEIGTIAEVFSRFLNEGTLSEFHPKETAVKSEVESFSEDDKMMCSDLFRQQVAEESRLDNSMQVKCNEGKFRQAGETDEAKVFLAVAGVDLDKDFKCNDQQFGLVSVDPLSRLSCLLRSLSSSKGDIDGPLSDTLFPCEPPVVASDLEEDSSHEQEPTTLFELQSSEGKTLAVRANEEEEREANKLKAASEKSIKSETFEDRCIVDENINYISPLSVNDAAQKDKGRLGSSLLISSAVLSCERCICMKDTVSDDADIQGIDKKEKNDASGAKSSNQTSSSVSQGEMGPIDITCHLVSLDTRGILNAQESRSLVPQEEKMITDDNVSQIVGKMPQDLSQTSAADDIQSFASDAQVTGDAAEEQDHSTVSCIGSSTNATGSQTPCSILDAKRRFFHSISQPVRISPHTIFKDDFPLATVATGCQALTDLAASDGRRAALITQPQKKQQQTEDNVLASREENAKRRLLPAIPTNQVPLDNMDVSLEKFTIGAVSQVNSPGGIIQTAKEPNVLSSSEGEIHQRLVQSNRRLLPSCEAFSHISDFESFDPSANRGHVELERLGSMSTEGISLLSGNDGRRPDTSGDGQEDAITDDLKGLTLADQACTDALTAENLKSKVCRGTRSASLGTQINNVCVIEETDSPDGNVAKWKMTERNLTKLQNQFNSSLPELSTRTQGSTTTPIQKFLIRNID